MWFANEKDEAPEVRVGQNNSQSRHSTVHVLSDDSDNCYVLIYSWRTLFQSLIVVMNMPTCLIV